MPLTMNPIHVLHPRDIGKLLPWRGRHHHSHRCRRNSSFKEALLTSEMSNGRWSNTSSEKVSRGCLPVYVGPNEKRFVIPMVYLSMPNFKELMEKAAEEFGFEQEGGLKIPCEEEEFEEVLFKCMLSKP